MNTQNHPHEANHPLNIRAPVPPSRNEVVARLCVVVLAAFVLLAVVAAVAAAVPAVAAALGVLTVAAAVVAAVAFPFVAVQAIGEAL